MITREMLAKWELWADEKIVRALHGMPKASPRMIVTNSGLSGSGLLGSDLLSVVCRALVERRPQSARRFAIREVERVSNISHDPDQHLDLCWLLRTEFGLDEENERSVRPVNLDTWRLRLAVHLRDVRDYRSESSPLWAASQLEPWFAWSAAIRAARWHYREDFDHAVASSINRALKALGEDADGWEP
jgi:hypothetical protein